MTIVSIFPIFNTIVFLAIIRWRIIHAQERFYTY